MCGIGANSVSGGCCTKDSEGNLVLEKNQDPGTALVQSIIGSQESKLAVGLVIGTYKWTSQKATTHLYHREQQQGSQPQASTSIQHHGLVPRDQCMV